MSTIEGMPCCEGAMGDSLSDARGALAKARDALLDANRHAGGRGDWAVAKKTLELAERTDHVRRELEALLPGAAAETVHQEFNVTAPTVEVQNRLELSRATKMAKSE